MLLRPSSLSNLEQSRLYDRAKVIMRRTDTLAETVKEFDNFKNVDTLEAKDEVSFSSRTISLFYGPSEQFNSTLLKDGAFYFDKKKAAPRTYSMLERRDETGSRVQTDQTTTYEYKSKGLRSRIVLDNASGAIDFKQKREVLGGLISWNVVE